MLISDTFSPLLSKIDKTWLPAAEVSRERPGPANGGGLFLSHHPEELSTGQASEPTGSANARSPGWVPPWPERAPALVLRENCSTMGSAEEQHLVGAPNDLWNNEFIKDRTFYSLWGNDLEPSPVHMPRKQVQRGACWEHS